MVKVSICCITFNHADNIRKCLDGFLMQQCDFQFEILIHDDASTDDTQKIILEYSREYPEIVKPILQVENQFQKGVKGFNFLYNFPRARGEYLAICEGDDYWTDPHKLSKQVELLDQRKDISLCFHNATLINLFDNSVKEFNNFKEPRIFTTKDLILRPWFVPTASIVLRSNLQFPNWKGVNGDLEMLLVSSLSGNLYFLPETMSVYHYGSPSSLSRVSRTKSTSYLYKKKWNLLNKFNKFTNYKFFPYIIIGFLRIIAGSIKNILR